MINVAQFRDAVQKLKQINWLYAKVDDHSVDDASRRIVESVSSTMLVKATAEDVKYFQALGDWIRNSQALLVSSITSSWM